MHRVQGGAADSTAHLADLLLTEDPTVAMRMPGGHTNGVGEYLHLTFNEIHCLMKTLIDARLSSDVQANHEGQSFWRF